MRTTSKVVVATAALAVASVPASRIFTDSPGEAVAAAQVLLMTGRVAPLAAMRAALPAALLAGGPVSSGVAPPPM